MSSGADPSLNDGTHVEIGADSNDIVDDDVGDHGCGVGVDDHDLDRGGRCPAGGIGHGDRDVVAARGLIVTPRGCRAGARGSRRNDESRRGGAVTPVELDVVGIEDTRGIGEFDGRLDAIDQGVGAAATMTRRR